MGKADKIEIRRIQEVQADGRIKIKYVKTILPLGQEFQGEKHCSEPEKEFLTKPSSLLDLLGELFEVSGHTCT